MELREHAIGFTYINGPKTVIRETSSNFNGENILYLISYTHIKETRGIDAFGEELRKEIKTPNNTFGQGK